MQLTPEQRVALDSGHPVRIVIDHADYVLMSTEVYDRMQSDHSVDDTYVAVEEALDRDDDPGLELYQVYK